MNDVPSYFAVQSDREAERRALRRALIEEFCERQAISREWLSLDEVGLFLARVRGNACSGAALIELMGHASVGAFDSDMPALLLLRDNVGVDAQLNPQWCSEGNGAAAAQVSSGAALAALRKVHGDDVTLSQVVKYCWARRDAVVSLLRKLGVDPAAMMTWAPAGLSQSPQAKTFAPYPDLHESALTPKVRLTRELLAMLWASGSPDWMSALAMATKATAKFKTLGRVVLVRGKPVSEITEDDIKRALGRK